MSRIIDETKLERIKEATCKMIVSHGFGGASVASIAKQARVAEGYLYRFYKGKTELVSDLFHIGVSEQIEKLESLLTTCTTISQIFRLYVSFVFTMANNEPHRLKFFYVLMHDYNFTLKEELINRLNLICEQIKQIGVNSGEISKNATVEEIFLLSIIYPIQFVNLRFKNLFGSKSLSTNDEDLIINGVLNRLKL